MDLGSKGRKALVTDGDPGIGLATARRLLEEGATVVISDLHEEKVKAAATELSRWKDTVHAFAADMPDPGSVAELERRVSDAVGDIDILVNSAGISGAQGQFHEIDDAGWMETLETNLMGPVRITRAFLPALSKGGWGRIVFIASEDAAQPYPDEILYCVSKAGLLALSKGLSRTYAKDGVLVNAVSPAFIATPMTDAMMDKRAEEQGTTREEAIDRFLQEQRPGMELGRRGEAEETAAVIVFLCSDRASFVNGSNYRVDAGSVATT